VNPKLAAAQQSSLRYEATLRRTRAQVLPLLLDGIQENSKLHDALLARSFADVVELEKAARKLQQRAVDRKWLEPFRARDDDDGGDGGGGGGASGGSGDSSPQQQPRRRASLSKKKGGGGATAGAIGSGSGSGTGQDFALCYVVQQSLPEQPPEAEATAGGDGGGGASADDGDDTTGLAFLSHVYRGAAVRALQIASEAAAAAVAAAAAAAATAAAAAAAAAAARFHCFRSCGG
jgi:hypothetical protein